MQLNNFFFRPITPYSHWVTDADSKYYNKWTESLYDNNHTHFKTSEHLINYKDEYRLALSIGYNKKPILKNRGSAIFIHCGNKSTSGCIAISEDYLTNIINWLDYRKYPYVYIHDIYDNYFM